MGLWWTSSAVALPLRATTTFLVALLMLMLPSVSSGYILEDPQFNVSIIENFFNSSGRLPSAQPHTNNWAVLVGTSIFWHNYRHVANVLSIYHVLWRLGIPDSQIILMIADDMACNTRNSDPGTIYNHRTHNIDLYGSEIEVDYRGYEVSVENFIRVLTGRHHEAVPRSKRLLTDERSNILIYMTGHGGEEFLKFQDFEEICSRDLADAFEQMWEKGRYNELLFVVDTCQATTLYQHFRSPNVLAVGSSSLAQNSYSHHTDYRLGVAMIDRFTYYVLDFFEQKRVGYDSKNSLKQLFADENFRHLGAQAHYRADSFSRPLNDVLLTDFFGSVLPVQTTARGYPLGG